MPFKHGAKIGPVLIAGLALPGVAQANDHAGAHGQAAVTAQGSGLTCTCSTGSGGSNGNAGGHATGHANANSQGHANGHANGNANAQGHAHSNGNASAHANANAKGNGHANAHANAHVNGHANGHVNGHLNARGFAHSNGEANGHAHEGLSTHSNGFAWGHAVANAHVGLHAGEQSFSNGCSIRSSGSNGRHNGWRFAVISGQFGGEGGESANVVIRASRKGEARPGKVMIWHRTRSLRTPAVPITISVNGMNGHGEASSEAPGLSTSVVMPMQATGNSGTTPATGTSPGESAVLGVNASGGGVGGGEAGTEARTAVPASATASRRQASGQLPFTGMPLGLLLFAAAGCLASGLALRRVASSQS